jgi:hypothetical protein
MCMCMRKKENVREGERQKGVKGSQRKGEGDRGSECLCVCVCVCCVCMGAFVCVRPARAMIPYDISNLPSLAQLISYPREVEDSVRQGTSKRKKQRLVLYPSCLPYALYFLFSVLCFSLLSVLCSLFYATCSLLSVVYSLFSFLVKLKSVCDDERRNATEVALTFLLPRVLLPLRFLLIFLIYVNLRILSTPLLVFAGTRRKRATKRRRSGGPRSSND